MALGSHRWSTLLVLAVLAAGAQAALTWSSTSTLDVEANAPPALFVKGSNADDRRYFKSFELSTNQTSFTADAKPRGGADMFVKDVVTLDSQDPGDLSITLTASQVSNVFVEDFEWQIRDGATPVATLDHREANPSASFTLPAGASYTFDLKVDLADGAGRLNSGISFDLQLEVS